MKFGIVPLLDEFRMCCISVEPECTDELAVLQDDELDELATGDCCVTGFC